jgi:hypothetical protein
MFGGENGISCTGTRGFISKKTIENGNGIKIWAGQPLRWWDLCSWTMGFRQNLGWEMGIRPPLQDPHIWLRWNYHKTAYSTPVILHFTTTPPTAIDWTTPIRDKETSDYKFSFGGINLAITCVSHMTRWQAMNGALTWAESPGTREVYTLQRFKRILIQF